MDRQSERAAGWFEDRLRGAGLDRGKVVRVDSPRRPVVERDNPWKDPEGIAEAAPILDSITARRSGAGTIVFLTDVEDDPIARVQAAVHLGRAAVARGLDVLLVDADIRHVGLSRWLPDRDLDAEGLVDVLQYGASVAGARRGSEIDGIDVLGVGSYRPEVSGLFNSDDLRRLQAQLRVSAGIVCVVGPSRLDGQRHHPLLGLADFVVLSMHLDPSLEGPLGELLAHLAAEKCPLGGVFTWAGPDDSDRFVDDALLERSRVLPRATEGSPFPGRGAARPPEEPGSGHVTRPLPTSPAPDPLPEDDAGPVSVRVDTERPRPGQRRPRSGGSSGAVRVLFIALAVVIVGFVGWWVMTWKSVEPTPAPVRRADRPPTQVAQTTPETGTAEPAETTVTDAGDAETGAAPTGGEEEQGPPDAGEEGAQDVAAAEVPPVADTGGVESAREAEQLLEQPVERATGDAGTAADPFEAGLRRAGEAWGLHLISSTDRPEAEAARARYERQGYSAVIREATVKGQLWYRVVVGDFPSRAAAGAFREQAQEKFRVDWVGVVKK